MSQLLGQTAFDSPISERGPRRLEYERPVRQWASLFAKSFGVSLRIRRRGFLNGRRYQSGVPSASSPERSGGCLVS